MTIKMLLAEDSEDLAELMQEYLSRQGYEVIVAHNGREAIAKYQPTIDVILFDIEMPLMGGIEAAHELRSKGGVTHRFLPIAARLISLNARIFDRLSSRAM